MRAVVIHAAHDLRIEERPVSAPSAGQVAIELQVGGICGSDLHYYNHGGFGPIRLREPMVLGHEVAGEIISIGADVETFKPGQLVSISPSRPCHCCEYCLRGQQNHCLNMRFYGSAMPFPHIQGAFQQHLIADAAQCVLAEGLSAGEAAMAEPLAVSLHAVRQVGDLVGKTVLVTGCGPIGILTIMAARRAGAGRIIATDLSDFTLEKAPAAGADELYNMASAPEALGRFAGGKGSVDVQFECSGAASALHGGVAVLRPGSTLVQLGLGGDMSIPMQSITAKEITLRGSFRFHEEFATAVAMMQRGLIDVMPLITHQFSLNEAETGFTVASDREQAIKAQIMFSSDFI